MRIVSDVASLRRALATLSPLAFVPTMGNLHAGHLSLVRLARLQARAVAVSIFVNRLQFLPGEDFERYPRTFERDCALLAAEGVELLFAPDEKALYPQPQAYLVQPPPVASDLEGRFRPGFFTGVATVVLKLLNCVQPTAAVFGKKDYQQLVLVRGMAREFNLPVEIVAGETVREPDGLAMSSRNAYLDASQRQSALVLHRSLSAVQKSFDRGESKVQTLIEAGKHLFAEDASVRLDYFEIVDPETLDPVDDLSRSALVAVAAFVGKARLIDNVVLAGNT